MQHRKGGFLLFLFLLQSEGKAKIRMHHQEIHAYLSITRKERTAYGIRTVHRPDARSGFHVPNFQ